MQQRLERELECARLEYARRMLWEEDYCSEESGSDGHEGGVEETFSVRGDGGFDRITRLDESRGDVRCGAAVTAMSPALEAGDRRDPEDVHGAGPRRGPTTTAVRLLCSGSRSSVPVWAAPLEIRDVL